MTDLFYFGVWADTRHQLWSPSGRPADENVLPNRLRGRGLDGSFCPDDTLQPHGLARIAYVDGWTVLAFWDRTGDARPFSNSAFITRGTLRYEQILLHIVTWFPGVWARIQTGGPVQLRNPMI